MRPLLAPVLVLALTLSSGCSDGDEERESARERWDRLEPASYSFTYRVGGMAGVSHLSVTVVDGEVTEHRRTGELAFRVEPKTIDDVFAMLAQDQREADEVEVEYDSNWGFPSRVSVDSEKDAVDDEFGYGIQDFRVLRR